MYYHNMQDKENDCGFAVSQTILQQLGIKRITFNMIKGCITNEISQGLSLQDLIDIFKSFAVISDAYEVHNAQDLFKSPTPFIATISNNGLPHYIVVHNVTEKKIVVSNPAKSIIEEIEFDKFLDLFTGYVILIEDSKEIRVPEKSTNDTFLSQFYKDSVNMIPLNIKIKIIVYTVLKLVAPLLIIMGFQYMMVFQIENISIINLLLMILISMILLVIYFYVNFENLTIKNRIEKKMQETLITQYYKGILEREEKDFVQNNSQLLGSFWNILQSVPGIIQKFYFKINFIILLLFLASLAFINVYLAVFSVILFITFTLFLSVIYKNVYNYQKQFVMEINNFGGTVTQLISSILDIKIFNKQNDSIEHLENSINEYSYSKNHLKNGETKIALLLDIFVYSIIISGFVLYITSFLLTLNVSAPILLLGLFLLFILATESKNTFNMFFEYQKSRVAIEYLQQEVNLFTPVQQKNTDFLEYKISNIQLKNITMQFGDKKILDNFNMNITAGEVVGIRGNNGSGKTTLLKILSGIINPNSGSIVINNTDTVSTLQDTPIPNQVMLYTPEYYIYNNTVKNNYDFNIFSYKNIKDYSFQEEINFPLDTPDNFVVGLSGENISLGQKNKILLLRSLKTERDVYLLDEPSTGLDYKTSISLINVIQTLAKEKNKIVLVVTHDPLLIKMCDRVIDLEKIN